MTGDSSFEGWEAVPVQKADHGWVLLDEIPIAAMIAVAAGTARLRRMPSDFSLRPRINILTTQLDVADAMRGEPFTAADQAQVDEVLNENLVGAGLPVRPAGFDWYLRLPSQFESLADVYRQVNRHLLGPDMTPKTVWPQVRHIVGTLYVDG